MVIDWLPRLATASTCLNTICLKVRSLLILAAICIGVLRSSDLFSADNERFAKPQPPVDIEWKVETLSRPANSAELAGRFEIRARSQPTLKSNTQLLAGNASSIQLRLVPGAQLTLKPSQATSFTFLLSREGFRPARPDDYVDFWISPNRRAQLSAVVSLDGGAAAEQRVRQSTLYLLTTDTRLYFGSSSMLDLELQKLSDDRSTGRITPAQYDEAIQKLITAPAR